MRPNLLLITTDQQRFDTIHALGNPHILTPHLNYLADEGIAFTRCYATTPICMASRATLMTGLEGDTTGLVDNDESIVPMRDHATLPGLLTRAGYQTRAQGKMHFEPMRAHYGFEQMELPADYFRQNPGAPLPKRHGVGENEIEPVISTADEAHGLSHWTVQRSIDFLETRDPMRPFFLWTSFTKPHPPWDPSLHHWLLYQDRSVPEPALGDWSADVEAQPQGFLASTYTLNNIQRFSAERVRDIRRAYYACITEVDYALGLLFARMREMGLFEDTWIVFTSDHGDMLGDHHMGAKSVHLEGSAHVPLLVLPPASVRRAQPGLAGARRDALATLADVMPTLLGIAGVEAEEALDGRDLLGAREERDFFGLMGDRYFCLMRGSVKYLWTALGGEELLFDLAGDPMERRNLAADAGYAATKAELRAEMMRRMERAGSTRVRDGALVPEPAIRGNRDVGRWPGFHSSGYPCDVLH